MAPLTRPEDGSVEKSTNAFIWEIDSLRKYELLVEYTNLQGLGQCPDGMYLIPDRNRLGGTLFIQEGAFEGIKVNFDLDYVDAYPHSVPMVWLRRNKNSLPHPLVDNDQCLHISRLIRERAPDESITMSSALRAIKTAFLDRALKKIEAEDCINYAVKHQ